MLAEIFDEVGVPAGVLNLVTGYGPVVGEAIAAHPGVDMVSFTGSTRAGRRVSELAAATVKKVAVELGGKSPNIILDDADLEKAVVNGIAEVLPELRADVLGADAHARPPREARAGRADRRRGGLADASSASPFDEATQLGPLVSEVQRERVRGYIRRGVEEGAKLVAGGARAAGGPRPRLLRTADGVQRGDPGDDHRPRGDLRPGAGDHALRRRGRRRQDRQRHRLRARRRRLLGLRGASQGGSPAASVPARSRSTARPSTRWPRSAGYKQSGNGRELGPYGIEEFLVLKSLQL